MRNVKQTARTLLMVAVMIASAILPMVPEATELRDEARAMRASISTDVTSVWVTEGGSGWYEVSLDEAPDGVLVVTPTSDNSLISVDPSYLKFTKGNWDFPQTVWLDMDFDDDANSTSAVISHALSTTGTVFANATLGDVSVTSLDLDIDTDGDGLADNYDGDDDNDGVDDADDAFPQDADESSDNDGDGIGDNADDDDDNDGTNDSEDWAPLDGDEDNDNDNDGIGDNADDDDDNDGVNDTSDAFPDDSSEWDDNDGDGIGDNADSDDDGDGVNDTDEESGCDMIDDCDGDGVSDADDAFPLDENRG